MGVRWNRHNDDLMAWIAESQVQNRSYYERHARICHDRDVDRLNQWRRWRDRSRRLKARCRR